MKQDRTIHNLKSCGLPDVPFFGHYRQLNALAPLARHRHRDAMELCYLVSGRQTYRVDGQNYVLKGNDVFVTFPNESHDSGRHPQERGELYWLQVVLDPESRHLLHLDPSASRALTQSLLSLPSRCFQGSDRIKSLFDVLSGHLKRPTGDRTCQRFILGHTLVALLLEFLDCAQQAKRRQTSTDINTLLTWIHARLPERITIAELAARMQLSPSRFMARFKSEVGMSAGEYMLRHRIEAGCAILQAGRPVLDAALESGFCSSQYFATVFKRLMQQTPREYQRNHGAAFSRSPSES